MVMGMAQARRKAVRRKSRKGTVIKVAGFKFKISAHNAGYSERWGGKTWYPHYVYRITVERLDGPKGKLSFTFHGSHADWRAGKTRLSTEDKIFAFRSYLEDALTYLDYDSPDEFMRAFGIKDPKEAKRIYNAAKRAYESIYSKLHLIDSDMYEITNELIEAENEDNLEKLLV